MSFGFEYPYLLPLSAAGILFFLVSRVPRHSTETRVPSIRIWKRAADRNRTPYFGLNAKITAESFARAGIVALLVLALAGARFTESRSVFKPLHIGFCNSISLLTGTRLTEAREAIRKVLSSVDSDTQATLYFFAPKPVSFSGTAAEVSKFVEKFRTLASGASPEELNTLMHAASSVIVSDKPCGGNLLFVGGPTENCGIISATKSHVLVYSATNRTVRLQQRQFDLKAGLNSIPMQIASDRIALELDDGFAADNTFILETAPPKCKVTGELDKFVLGAIAAAGFETTTGSADIEIASAPSIKKGIQVNVDDGRLQTVRDATIALNRIFKEGDSAIFTFANLSDCTGTSQCIGEPVLSVGELTLCSLNDERFYLYFSAADKSIVRTQAFPVLWLRMLDNLRDSESFRIPPTVEADSFVPGRYNLSSLAESSNSHTVARKFELPPAGGYTSKVVSLQPILLWAAAAGGLLLFIFSAGR